MTSNAGAAEESSSKRRKEMDKETSGSPQLSCLEKPDPALSESSHSLYKADVLEKVLNDMGKEINSLLSKYAYILSERAAMDAAYVQELDGILKEARTMENHLKQKRESLRDRFAVIANTLKS
ncbi:PREDICTED: testis-expressed sequence 12 protein [Crocodylus porosus]|uniref:testis-expressed sequence 12 protein n=1 Tax=Crocodylus porosus TaxID=8502 RepID=UPI00093CA6CA|nr:PREDICTED: testis-expressed sequence 12 protein [Crocodylus porosus]